MAQSKKAWAQQKKVNKAKSTINSRLKIKTTIAGLLEGSLLDSVTITIKEKKGSTKIVVPWNPDEIKVKSGGVEFVTHQIMDLGEVARPAGTGISEISWESMFPGNSRSEHPFMKGTWQQPKHYHTILNKWKKKRTLLKLTISGTPVNLSCYLKEYESTYSGGAGDVHYQLAFLEHRTVSITTKSKKKKKSATKSSTKRAGSGTSGTYVVKKGDCLWNIAKKLLGSATRWKEIYKANKSVIESVAKKRGMKSSSNGHWIFPGTKLKIPKK